MNKSMFLGLAAALALGFGSVGLTLTGCTSGAEDVKVGEGGDLGDDKAGEVDPDSGDTGPEGAKKVD